MKRTGSMGSRVPPAVISTSQAGQVVGAEGGLDGGHDVLRVGQATGADVAAGQPALVRRDDDDAPAGAGPRRLSCTAGCSHISVCIAGQTTTGARVASRVAVSRSSEMPAA